MSRRICHKVVKELFRWILSILFADPDCYLHSSAALWCTIGPEFPAIPVKDPDAPAGFGCIPNMLARRWFLTNLRLRTNDSPVPHMEPTLTPSAANALLEKASVPEHSVDFMRAMSGGEAFLLGAYLFFTAEDRLLCIGYPIEGGYDPAEFDRAITAARQQSGAVRLWAICPHLPERLAPHCRTRDAYYVLAAEPVLPRRLERTVARATAVLRAEHGDHFTIEHRRLWGEFVSRRSLPDDVRRLFERTEHVIGRTEGLILLNAWDSHGRLAACMLIDTAPRRFASYLIGARSLSAPVPHASDFLMREAIALARRKGKEFLHLGLGVNEGIRRFKTKWGAYPAQSYEYASWQETDPTRATRLMHALTAASDPLSGAALHSFPRRRPFRMLWELEKNGRRSWLAGTAHFFCCSFEDSLRHLFAVVDIVMFEGPLDPASMARVSAAGRNPVHGSARLVAGMTEEDIRRLERVVCGPRGFWAQFLGLQSPDPPDVRALLADARPWMAFFSLWAAFLARHGWNQSVDLEAWNLALTLGKNVVTMETIPEQIEVLDRIPVDRIVRFLRSCSRWRGYMRQHAKAYLQGDPDRLAGTTVEFPTRTETVIGCRDARLLDRMRPYIEQGRTAVFVGTAHLLNLRPMLMDAGFAVRRSR